MKHEKFFRHTTKWTNVLLDRNRPATREEIHWLNLRDGGKYHIHRSGTAITFERNEDAMMFVLKFGEHVCT
jgi:hypothetical protein